MEFVIQSFSQTEWNEITSRFDHLTLTQTWEYGQAKSQTGPWRVERGIIQESGETIGAVQGVVRPVPLFKSGLMWVNQGPLIKKPYQHRISKILSLLKEKWVDGSNHYLRIAPPIFKDSGIHHALSDTIHPQSRIANGWESDTIDLTRDESFLFKNLKPKWRNQLRKALRSDIHIEWQTSQSVFDRFIEMYQYFLTSKNIHTTVTPMFLKAIQALLPEASKMPVLTATKNGVLLGSILISLFGKHSMYLANVSTPDGRMCYVNNALLWHAIIQLKARHYVSFDLGGVSGTTTPRGIYHFKRGLNGMPYRYIGSFDFYRKTFRSRLIKWRLQLLAMR